LKAAGGGVKELGERGVKNGAAEKEGSAETKKRWARKRE